MRVQLGCVAPSISVASRPADGSQTPTPRIYRPFASLSCCMLCVLTCPGGDYTPLSYFCKALLNSSRCTPCVSFPVPSSPYSSCFGIRESGMRMICSTHCCCRWSGIAWMLLVLQRSSNSTFGILSCHATCKMRRGKLGLESAAAFVCSAHVLTDQTLARQSQSSCACPKHLVSYWHQMYSRRRWGDRAAAFATPRLINYN